MGHHQAEGLADHAGLALMTTKLREREAHTDLSAKFGRCGLKVGGTGKNQTTMARKQPKLCWDDVADLDSRMLSSWNAFQADLCETVEVEGDGLKDLATFFMDSTG